MPGHAADRNLLFGILALQMDFITRDALIAAMNAWALAKHRSLGEILVERGSLAPRFRSLLEPMVDAHVERHGDDPAASLAALSSVDTAASALRHSIADPEILESLATIAPNRAEDPFATKYGNPFEPFQSGVRYTKVRDHAKGGLGVVFVARDEELNREVALKEIQDHHADDPANRARFLIEAEVTGGLEHPGIVPVYGLGSYQDGRPFYAMRFIRGNSLKDAIAAFHSEESLKADSGERALALQKLLRRFLDVCNAIAYAHSRGVLHRDLKPDNVMIGKYGETLVVDWGLAKTTARSGINLDAILAEATLNLVSTASGSHQTLPGSVIGTPAYMSPEQAAGRLDLLGPASDVYSLGATLYTLLTGQAPFVERDLSEVLRRVEHGEFARPRELQAWIDPALEAVCLKAMTLKPGGRYASPRGLADDIDRWLAGEPVLCWREPTVRKIRRWVDRNRTLVTSSVSLLVTAVVVLGIAIVLINAEKTKVVTEKTKVSEESRLRGIAVEEKTIALDKARASTSAAEEARRKEAEAALLAKAEAAKVVGVIDVLVNTFRVSDPIGLEGLGVRRSSESVQMLSARELLDRSAEHINRTLADQPLVRATLIDTIGEVYRSLVVFDKADQMIRSALQVRLRLLGPESSEVATSLIHLGWLHQDKGQFDEAERCYQDAYRIRKNRHGPDSYEALDAKGRLAMLWMIEEETEKAEGAFREVINKLDSSSKHDADRLVAIARLGLAAVLLDSGDMGRMPVAFLESKRAMKVLLGKDDADQFFLAAGKFQKALLASMIGQHVRAEQLLRESLDTFQRLLGPQHPYLCFPLHEIGTIQQRQGKLDEAEASYRTSLDLIRKSVGFRHPKAKNAVDVLGQLLVQRNRFEEARKLYRELIEDRQAAFGRDHVWVADALVSFAIVVEQQSNAAEYRRLLEEALKIYRKRSDHVPRGFVVCQNNLAHRLIQDGAIREAEPLLREALPLARKQFGTSSHNVGSVLMNLTRCLTLQGHDDEETDRLFTEAIAILRSPLDPLPKTGLSALSDLAKSEQRRGLHDRAEAHAREALEASRQVCRDRPSDVAFFAKGLAVVIAGRGDVRRAIPLMDESASLYRSALPAARSDFVNTLSLTALAHAAENDMAASRDVVANLLREVASINDAGLLNDITWAASRFSRTVDDPPRLEALARRVLAARPGNQSQRMTGSAALLRAGRFEEAARRLEELRHVEKPEPVISNLYLAIAYRRLGRLLQANDARERAIASIAQTNPKAMSWDLRLQLRILQQEFDALSQEPPGELPSNVFTPEFD